MAIRDISGVTLPPVVQQEWSNWSNTLTTAAEIHRPSSLEQLVAVVVNAEQRNLHVRAAGRRWAFDDVAAPDHISVDLSDMPGAFKGDLDFLVTDHGSRLSDRSHRLVLAKAGAPLWRLNEDLWDAGFSMLTLGGSQGQSLAGAFSTGTHGTDLDRASITDAIHAIHLVGSGGQEYWIERTVGVTDPSRIAEYEHWDDSIVELRNDEVFRSALVSMGRFGIIFAVVLEVAPRYWLREYRVDSSWQDFEPMLQLLRAPDADLSDLYDDDQLRAIKINLDPYARGHGWFGGLSLRWTVAVPSVGDPVTNRPVEASSKGPDALSREIGAAQAWAHVGAPPGGSELFAQTARDTFKKEQSAHHWLDRNYFITSGKPTIGLNYAQYYDAFDQWGPFVWSMEFFFDGATQDATDFVHRAYGEWNGYLGGYIAIRFARRSDALLGPERFDATVIVEVTILQGFPDSRPVADSIMAIAAASGAIPHWGQEHLLTPPEVQGHYGADATTWRRSLRRVSVVGNSTTFSNRHSRRLGLEPSPALMLCHDDRIRAWLDSTQGLFAAGFFEGPSPPPDGLTISRGDGEPIVVQENGVVHAKQRPPAPGTPGNLLIKRNDRTVAQLTTNGAIHASTRHRFRSWMR